MNWSKLDIQLARWSDRLISELHIPADAAVKLATTIAADVRFLPKEAKIELRTSSPVALKDRLEELVGFRDLWMRPAQRETHHISSEHR
jgi:hypothetical protein